MVVLDTNVISEMMKPAGQRLMAAFAWLGRQDGESLYTTTITVAEILAGVAMLPRGKRKEALRVVVSRIFGLFEGRCLPLISLRLPSSPTPSPFGGGAANRRNSFDLLIAAIARANGMVAATRNTADFEDCGVRVIDPWKAAR